MSILDFIQHADRDIIWIQYLQQKVIRSICFPVFVLYGIAGMNRMKSCLFPRNGSFSFQRHQIECTVCTTTLLPRASHGVRQKWTRGEPARRTDGWGTPAGPCRWPAPDPPRPEPPSPQELIHAQSGPVGNQTNPGHKQMRK